MGGNSHRGHAVLAKHPLDGIEPVEGRGIERGAEETPRVLGITDASGWQAQTLELGKPAGNRRPRTEARRRVEEGAALARHRIFVTASEIESGQRRVVPEWLL